MSMFKQQILVMAISMALGSLAYADQKSADFTDADKDEDGTLSYSEAQAALSLDEARFSKLDADGNGRLSQQEFEQVEGQQTAGLEKASGEEKMARGEADRSDAMPDRRDASGVPDEGLAMSGLSTLKGPLADKTVETVKGMEVKNVHGENIGEVDKVVLEIETNKLFGVLSVGGFLGLGDKLVPVALDRLEVDENSLIIPESITKDELKNATAYSHTKFVELKDEQLLSRVPAEGISPDEFALLDINRDNQLSRDEAMKGKEALVESWEQFDKNEDQRIDRSEFSAFEQTTRETAKSRVDKE